MEKPGESLLKGTQSTEMEWGGILRAGVQAQRLVPGAVCVGGTAAALYARHRISYDTDHVLPALKANFEEVRAHLEAQPEWKTARIRPPVLILGSINKVEVGFRQMRRKAILETRIMETEAGSLTVPTLDEMLCMKAFLAYERNTTRDFLDFAALTECASADAVLRSLGKLDSRYGELQTASVGLEVAKALSAPEPFDLDESELPRYKGVSGKWQQWETIRTICQRFGVLLGEKLIRGGN